MFNKPLDEINFEDIKKLKKNKIPESSVIEYKQDVIDDAKLIKEICGFANAQGGYLIFGIKQSDDEPPIPKSFPGISLKKINMQRVEQVINTNIASRISVKFAPPVRKGRTNKYVIVIRIPEGMDKPYMSTKTGKFYLRYNNETRDMTEPEISSMYRQRFSVPQKVSDYINKTISYHKVIAKFAIIPDKPLINGHCFIFPPNIERRRIEKVDRNTLDISKTDRVILQEGHSKLPLIRQYNKYGLAFHDAHEQATHRIEVHRNALIHSANTYGKGEKKRLASGILKDDIFLTLNFAHWAYSQIGYFGQISIIVLIENTKDVLLPGIEPGTDLMSLSDEIRIERESYSWELYENSSKIGKSIMDELMNHFGHYEYSF